MIYRTFGRTQLRTSAIGLGTWPLGGPNTIAGMPIGWKPITEEQAAATIRKALDVGITFFDTSNFYGQGRSEELLGRYIPSSRHDVILATKVGLLPEVDPARPQTIRRCFTPDCLRAGIEGSLRRLRRDYVDIYQLHGPDSATLRSDDTWTTLERLRRDGKIRYIGVSVSSRHATDLQSILDNPLVDSIQVKHNVAQIKNRMLLDQVSRNGCAVLARVPFEHGLLLGKYEDAASLHEDDHRREMLDEARSAQFRRFQDHIRERLPDRARTPAEVPLVWLLGDPNVTVVLCGATSPEQVEANAALADAPLLSAGEHAIVEEVAAATFG